LDNSQGDNQSEIPYPVVVWWLYRTQKTLPAENIYKLPAKLAATVLLLEREMGEHEAEFLSLELAMSG
jgi:hypothetical protein